MEVKISVAVFSFFFFEPFFLFSFIHLLGGYLVTTAWRVLRLRMEETTSRYGG
jgi:uncharacterized membrane protein